MIAAKSLTYRIHTACLAGLLAAFGLSACSRSEDRVEAGARSARVTRGSIEELVTAQGKLEPREYVDVGTQVSGQLKKLHVAVGDSVTEGELLAEIDPRIYEARVEADTARLDTLRAQLVEEYANLVLARQRLEREQTLMRTNATSRQTLQEADAAVRSSEARMLSISAQAREVEYTLDGDRTNLGFTSIRAPISGVVADLPAREGQTFNASQTAPTLLQLANLSTMTVRAQVAEADVPRIRPGIEAYFSTLGEPERRWRGAVRQVLPTPEIVNDVVLFNVLVDVDNDDGALMKGMSAQVFFVLGRAKDVPLLPAEALIERAPEEDAPPAKAYRVQVVEHGASRERIVHIGLMTRDNAQVVSGLVEGDELVLQLPKRDEIDQRPSRRQGGRGMMGPRL